MSFAFDPHLTQLNKTPLLHHYHPTISLLAQQLLSSQPLAASADLSLNTLSHFLDRFVYKNAKKTVSARGVSAMQPAASGLDGTGVKLMKREMGKTVTVNDPSFAKRREEDVPVDEVFFHKFFARKSGKKGKKGGDESDDEEDDEGEDEAGDEEMDLTGDEAAAGEEDADSEDGDDEDEKQIWKVSFLTPPF